MSDSGPCSSVSTNIHNLVKEWPSDSVPFLSSNSWGDVIVPSFKHMQGACCNVTASSNCTNSICRNWSNQIECRRYAHGLSVTCCNMQFQTSTGFRLGLSTRIGCHLDRYSLVTLVDIPSNSFIGEHTGTVCLADNIDFEKNGHVLPLDGGLYLDSGSSGSITRFVQHSCTPNCVFQSWLVPHSSPNVTYLPRIGLFAICDISAGSLILADRRVGPGKTFPGLCACNNETCIEFQQRDRWRKAARVFRPQRAASEFDIVSVSEPENDQKQAREHELRRIINIVSESSANPTLSVSSMGVFQTHGFKFSSIDPEDKDVTTIFVNKVDKFPQGDVNMKHYVHRNANGTWDIHIKVFGQVFCAHASSEKKARRQVIIDCLKCFQAGAYFNGGEKNIVLDPATVVRHEDRGLGCCVRKVEDFLLLVHQKLRDYNAKLRTFRDISVETRSQHLREETAKLCASIHVYLESPLTLLEYLRIDSSSIHRGLPLAKSPSVCLAKRNKTIEIGAAGRMSHFKKKYVIFSTSFGLCLVKVSSPRGHKRLENALREHGASLHNIVDVPTWNATSKQQLTVENLVSQFTDENVDEVTTRSNYVYVSVLEQVLYPLQTALEVQQLVELLEQEASQYLPSTYLARLRNVGREPPSSGPDVVVTIGNMDAALSSMVCAQQLGLTDTEYLRNKDVARQMMCETGPLSRHGFMEDDVPETEWQTLRQICDRWFDFVGKENLCAARREIQGGVEEWTLTGKDDKVNDAFFNGIAGTSFAQKLCPMPRHEKGLSAVARTPAGHCFARGEFWGIMIAEAMTDDTIKNINSFVKLCLVTNAHEPRQAFHADDMRPGTVLHTCSLNYPRDNPMGYSGTLVSAGASSFQREKASHFAAVCKALECGWSFEEFRCHDAEAAAMFKKCYLDDCRLLPSQLEDKLRPLFVRFVGGNGMFSLGPYWHGGPGTMNIGASVRNPRIVMLTITSVGDDIYDGGHQVFVDQFQETFMGKFCFLALAHVVDAALVSGVHVGDSYDHVLLDAHPSWRGAGISSPWSKGHFYGVLVEAVLMILVPDKTEEILNGTKHVPGRIIVVRKRKSDGTHKRQRYRTRFHRDDVSACMIMLWNFLNRKDEEREVWLEKMLQKCIPMFRFASWNAAQVFRQLVVAYRAGAHLEGLEFEVSDWATGHGRSDGFPLFGVLYITKLNRARASDCYARLTAEYGNASDKNKAKK